MKKTFVAVVCAASMLLATTACGRTQMTQVTEFELMDDSVQYKNFVPMAEIVKGNTTAIETISKAIGKNAYLNDEILKCNGLEEWTVRPKEESELLSIFMVEDYPSKTDADRIVFLYEDDTKAAVANPENFNFVDENSVDLAWKDYTQNNVLAYYYEGTRTSYILMPESEGVVTSVWAVNTKSGEIHEIYHDWNCPIWG